jgi:feruloyl esterase
VISHDSGHKGAVFDNAFMADQRAALDFAESSVREVTLLGKAITRPITAARLPGPIWPDVRPAGAKPCWRRSAILNCSTGWVGARDAHRQFNLATTHAAVTFNQAAPRDGAGLPIPAQIFSANDRKVILNGLLDQCDALDGVKDGMIANVAACHFRPAALICASGNSQNCLTPIQAEVLSAPFNRRATGRAMRFIRPSIRHRHCGDRWRHSGLLPTGMRTSGAADPRADF